ncbi:MAG: hypothetical protein WDN76_09355 [Alphaproteobacteria bacterium]
MNKRPPNYVIAILAVIVLVSGFVAYCALFGTVRHLHVTYIGLKAAPESP